MKTIHGSDLTISADGSVLLASKSCTIDLSSELIKVSSPTDGEWEHTIPGRKKWSLTTNHLVQIRQDIQETIEAQAFGYKGMSSGGSSWIQARGQKRYETNSRGLTLVFPFEAGEPMHTWDTYGGEDEANAQAEVNDMIDYLNEIGKSWHIVAIVSWDAFGMTDELKAAIENNLHVDMSAVQSVWDQRSSLAIIGGTSMNKGIMSYSIWTNQIGTDTHVKLYLEHGEQLRDTPLRDFCLKVGNVYTLRAQTAGLPYDSLTGTAICRSAKIQATRGNLITGSFTFEGTGGLK